MSEDWRNRLLALKEELEAVTETGEASSAVVELDQTKVGRLSRDEPINPKRLEFDPTAMLCIDCANKSEIR